MDANAAHMTPPVDEDLPVGTVLCGDQFTITDRLGAGGFGITYIAKDNTLGRTVVIKECFPDDSCYRKGKDVVPRSSSQADPVDSIVRMFMREAQSLAKLRHPNIVGVHRAFEENRTAYMALDLIDGRDLIDVMEDQSATLSPARVKDILVQLLDAIEKVHELDLLHRDISPDNIIIEKNGTPVLIDFGAARSDSSRRTRAVTSLMMVKDGYSPQEFYVAGSIQAPCSDLYALAATFYHLISGEAPINSQTRMIEVAGNKPDPCEPLAGRILGYDETFLQAVDTAMHIHPSERLQSAAQWRALIADVPASDASQESAPTSDLGLDVELSLSKLVEETNDVVRKTRLIAIEPEEVEPEEPEKPEVPDWLEEFNRESLEASKPAAPLAEETDEEPVPSIGAEGAEPGHLTKAGEIVPKIVVPTRPVSVPVTEPRTQPLTHSSARKKTRLVSTPPSTRGIARDVENKAVENEVELRKESERLRTALATQKLTRKPTRPTRSKTTPQMPTTAAETASAFGKHLVVGILLGLVTFLLAGVFNPSVFSIY